MKPLVHLEKPVAVDVCVNLSRAYISVPEHFLDYSQISAVLQKM
jgi:hypothetical protein